jgi:hypothetical protein
LIILLSNNDAIDQASDNKLFDEIESDYINAIIDSRGRNRPEDRRGDLNVATAGEAVTRSEG